MVHCLEMQFLNRVAPSGKVVLKVLANNEHFAATWLEQTSSGQKAPFLEWRKTFTEPMCMRYNGTPSLKMLT